VVSEQLGSAQEPAIPPMGATESPQDRGQGSEGIAQRRAQREFDRDLAGIHDEALERWLFLAVVSPRHRTLLLPRCQPQVSTARRLVARLL
jgi:hypothetical protein